MLKSPLFGAQSEKTKNLIRVYDLFKIDDDYILDHLKRNYPGRSFQPGGSFLPVFSENMKKYKDLLLVRSGDVIDAGYPDESDIEVFGVAICKAPVVTDFVVREFFPRLMPGALVIQQDFIHEFHPHIHLSMLILRDHFEKFVEVEWGGSVAYRCVKRIDAETIRERFGQDLSWYADVEANAARLRWLVDDMLYDGNRWTIVLTLGWNYAYSSRDAEARSVYQEACVRYPHFQPHQNTVRRLAG